MAKPRDLVRELWNWERCKNKIRSLRGRLGFPDADELTFLGLSICLNDGSIHDLLRNQPSKGLGVTVYFVLHGYANAKTPVPETSRLVSFNQLVGGQAYYKAFEERSIQLIAKTFSREPELFVEAAKLLGGTLQAHGEYSAKIYSLPLVPLTIVLWAETEEFPASANVLFDSSANNYLSTEELAGLGGLTFARLRQAAEALKTKT